MPTNATLVSALQKPLSVLALVLQQPPSPVSPCSHHTVTLVTDPAITAIAAINPFRYATIPTTKALASYVTVTGLWLTRGVKTATEVGVRAIQDHKVIEWNTCWKCRLSEGTEDM